MADSFRQAQAALAKAVLPVISPTDFSAVVNTVSDTPASAVTSSPDNIVGCWGETISFYVNGNGMVPMRNMNKSLTARWKEHQIVGKKPLSEFAGPDVSTVTLSVTLSATMGVRPRATISTLEKALEAGTVDYLYIGGKKVGTAKMKLTSMSEAWECIWNDGRLVKATVDLTFSEYVKKSYKHGKNVAGTKVPWEFIVGDKPKFTGGKVYKKCNAKKGGKKKKAVKVKVLEFRKGKKHPYKVEAIVNKKKAEAYTQQVKEIQEAIKKANRTQKKKLQAELNTLKNSKPLTKSWKGWVNDGTLKA